MKRHSMPGGQFKRQGGRVVPRSVKSRLAVAFTAMFVLAACGAEGPEVPSAAATGASQPAVSSGGTAQQPTGTLTVGVVGLGTEVWTPPTALNDEKQVMDLVADTLIRVDPETREFVPGLAESWSVSEDGLTWTFTLREDVPFHDDWGTLTAEDVRFTWEMFLDEAAVHPRAAVYRSAIDGDIENFEIVSDYEFRIHTPTPMVTLPAQLIHPQVSMHIVSKEYWESVGEEEAAQHPIGTGPFRFVSHEPGQEVTVEAVENHYRQTPHFQTVVLRIVPDEAGRFAQLQAGDIDMAAIGLPQQPQAEAAGLQLFSIPTVGTSFLALGGMYYDHPNHDADAPWIQDDNPEQGRAIREALTYAIDRQAIVDQILFGQGQPAPLALSFPPGPFPFNDPDWEIPPFDPERARELLAEGGYPDGFPVEFPIFEQSGRPSSPDIAEAVAGMLEEIGIEVNRYNVEFNPIINDRLIDRTMAGEIYQFTAPFYDEPLSGLLPAYLPTSTLAHLHHPTITDYAEQMSNEPDLEARLELARELGDFIIEERIFIPIAGVNALWAAGQNVGGAQFISGLGALVNVEYITHGD